MSTPDPILIALLLVSGLPILRGALRWGRQSLKLTAFSLALGGAVYAAASDEDHARAAAPFNDLSEAASALSWSGIQARIAAAAALPSERMGDWSDEEMTTFYEVENQRYTEQIQATVYGLLDDLSG